MTTEELKNIDISDWDVSKVINMSAMFFQAEAFNQPLDKWNVSNVEDMRYMFYGATEFNQDLESWGDKLRSDVDIMDMFIRSGLEGNEPSWYLERVGEK